MSSTQSRFSTLSTMLPFGSIWLLALSYSIVSNLFHKALLRIAERIDISTIARSRFSLQFKIVYLHTTDFFGVYLLLIVVAAVVACCFVKKAPALSGSLFAINTLAISLLFFAIAFFASNELFLLKGPLEIDGGLRRLPNQ